MKTINRLFASVVMVTAAGVASAQGAAKEFYVEAGLAPTKISSVEVTPVVARATLGKNINENLSIEGVYAFTAVKDSLTILNTNVDISVAGYGIYLKPKFEVAKGTEVFGRIGYTSAKYTASAGNVSTIW